MFKFDDKFSTPTISCDGCKEKMRAYKVGCRQTSGNTCRCRAQGSTREMETAQIYTKQEFLRFPIFPSRRALIRRPFGIELETTNGAEFALQAYSMSGFGGVGDSTITAEFVNGRQLERLELYSPIFTDDSGLDKIRKLCAIPLRTNESCGYHLHLSIDGWQDLELHKLLLVCLANKELFWSLVGPRRRGNSYCYDNYPDNEMIDQIEPGRRFSPWEALADGEQGVIETFGREMQADPFGGSSSHNIRLCRQIMLSNRLNRYNWLNLTPWVSRRAIEIRSHEGTVDYNTIRSWILLWQGIFDFIEETPLKALLENSGEIPLEELTIPSVAAFYDAKRIRPTPTLFEQDIPVEPVNHVDPPTYVETVDPPLEQERTALDREIIRLRESIPIDPAVVEFTAEPVRHEYGRSRCPCRSCRDRRAHIDRRRRTRMDATAPTYTTSVNMNTGTEGSPT